MKNKRVYYIFFIIIIICASFSVYAPINYKFLNSDQGIHVLMAANFELKNSIYYWGQNRLGSLLPLLSSFLVNLRIDPLWAVSIIQYLLLLGAVFLINKLVGNYLLKIVLATFIFFPLTTYAEIINIGQPNSSQIFIIALLFFIGEKICNKLTKKNILLILIFWVLSIISIWVSELSFIPVFLIFTRIILLNKNDEKKLLNPLKKIIKSVFTISILIGVSSIIYTQKFLKNKFKDEHFESFGVNTFDEVLNALSIRFDRYLYTLKFTDSYLFINLFTWIISLFIVLIIIIFIKEKINYKKIIKSPSFLYFMMAFLTYSAINFSAWAGIENYPHRYYVFSYTCFIISIVYTIDGLLIDNKHHFKFQLITLCIAVLGGLSYINLDRERERFKMNDIGRKITASLKQSTLIGDYWFTYAMCSYNANELTGVAHDGQYLRNSHQLKKAFNKTQNIYLIRNNWYDSFPETVIQYGYVLETSKQEAIKIGNAVIKKYNVSRKTNKELILKDIINKIKNNSEWFSAIKEKAKNNNISIEESLKRDAEYMYELSVKEKNN